MRHRRVVSISIFCTLFLGAAGARGQDVTTLITFQEFPVGNKLVTTQYTATGTAALFHENFIVADPATTGNQILVNEELGTEFGGGNMLITFISPQNTVSLNGSFYVPGETDPAFLQAFDANDNLLEQQGPITVAGGDLSQVFSISRPVNEIDHVRFVVDSVAANAIIDNLQFTGEPPPPPSGQPIVVIDTPTSGFSDAKTVTIAGTVTATNLFQPVRLFKEFQAQPGQTATSTTLVPLTQDPQNPTVYSFSFQESIPAGQVTLTITAQNIWGITGSDQVVLTNLPGGVLADCTPSGSLGSFQYAIELGTCTLNICQFGAITSHDASGTSHKLTGANRDKWLAVTDRRLPNNLGCPTSDIFRPTTQRVSHARQDFERGRLYSVAGNVFYVPGVFAQAMAVSGEEDRVGVPTADPSVNNFVLDVDTDWFQHFDRRFAPGDLGSTIEIRRTRVSSGNRVPEMLVERQGSDLNELLQIDKGTGSLSASTATQWEHFPCTGSGPWTCTVTPPKQHTPPTQKLLDDIHGFCAQGNAHSCDGIGSACVWRDCFPISTGTEWGSLAERNPGDFPPVLGPPTPPLLNFIHKNFRGWVNNAHFAASDYPFTHSFTRDFTTHMRQLPEYDDLMAGQFDEFDTEVEIEWYYFQSMWGMDLPGKGDLYHVYGRWITDCGHHPYPSEIHPPGIMATIRTAPWPTAAAGSPTTNVHLAANGFFFDSDTIRIDPPPRPSPNAGLFVVMPRDTTNDFGDITIDTKIFVDHIEITLKRTPPVTDVNVLVTIVDPSGEMFWHGGLGSYSGIWNVGWQ
jgi:hypothetical protein